MASRSSISLPACRFGLATSSGCSRATSIRDMVLNRRILVVNLPELENSDASLATLGKLWWRPCEG
jgi:hypothetical protein